MSGESKTAPLKYAAVRCYVQEGGASFKAVATVERAGEDGKTQARTEFSSVHGTAAEALSEALTLAGFMEE